MSRARTMAASMLRSPYASGLKVHARLSSAYGLPSCMGLDRGAGSWSRQNAVALDGTTFITLGTAEDEPRWDFGGGLEGLLLEPTRTNVCPIGTLIDAGNNDIPDGWAVSNAGAFTDLTWAPTGGVIARAPNGVGLSVGFQVNSAAVIGTTYTASLWVRGAGLGAGETILTWSHDAGTWRTLALAAGTWDWTRLQTTPISATANNGPCGILTGDAALAGTWSAAEHQVENGDCASSFIPTSAGSVTRAAELLTIDPSVVGRHRGDVQIKYRFDYASTQALTVRPCLFPWANGYEVVFDPADDKIKVVVGGADCAETAALAFARQSWHDIRVIYDASGQRLIVDGTAYDDATAWGDPGVLAPYLNSRAASVNCRPGAIARFTSAWL